MKVRIRKKTKDNIRHVSINKDKENNEREKKNHTRIRKKSYLLNKDITKNKRKKIRNLK